MFDILSKYYPIILEMLGFSLAACEIYAPKFTEWLEQKIDYYGSFSNLVNIWDLIVEKEESIVTIILFGAGLGLATIPGLFVGRDYFIGSNEISDFLLSSFFVVLFFTFAFGIAYIFLIIFRAFGVFLFSIVPRLIIHILNKIHPDKSCIGSFGLIVGGFGLSLNLLSLNV